MFMLYKSQFGLSNIKNLKMINEDIRKMKNGSKSFLFWQVEISMITYNFLNE